MIIANQTRVHTTTYLLKCFSLTVCVVLWLSMLCSLYTVLALSGVLSEDGFLEWLSVFRSGCLDRSSTDIEHCCKFFLCWCGRLLRQVGGFRKSGMKALCAFFWPSWHEAARPSIPEDAFTDKPVLAFSVAHSPSSEFEMKNLVCMTAGLLWERCLGLGSPMSEKWWLDRRLCCGLLNIIQYGGQDGSSSDEEKSWGQCSLAKPLCTPISTLLSRLNSYCQMDKHHVKEFKPANHRPLVSHH